MEGGLRPVELEAEPRPRVLDGRVDVDDARLRGEPRLEALRCGADFVVADAGLATHLDGHRRDDRGAGRQLDDLEARSVLSGDRLEPRADSQRHLVAARLPLALVHEIDPQVALVGELAELVVADHPVEVDRGGLAGVGGDVGHLLRAADDARHLAEDRVGSLQRRPLGKIDDDLQLELVVERQHLQRDAAGHRDPARRSEQQSGHQQERPAQPAVPEHRPHQPGVRAIDPRAADGLVVVLEVDRVRVRLHVVAEHVVREPRRHRERDQQAHQHRERHVQGHGCHVGPHHPGDEEQRDEAHHHRERREDDRRADLVDRGQNGLERLALSLSQVPVDVLDVDDRVVDDEPERQRQREQRHAVDRVAGEFVDEERQRERDRHGGRDHQALADAERQRDQRDHDDDRDPEALEQLVDLVIGGAAVVSRHAPVRVVREQVLGDRCDPLLDLLRDVDRVRPLAFGDG
ncbi:MAG: hypothetical protein O3B85_10970, partial [Planctomycetota bacterium]|nr:hypothetical protein [Planctomycetota bacterium]